jgi:hypothetical protein
LFKPFLINLVFIFRANFIIHIVIYFFLFSCAGFVFNAIIANFYNKERKKKLYFWIMVYWYVLILPTINIFLFPPWIWIIKGLINIYWNKRKGPLTLFYFYLFLFLFYFLEIGIIIYFKNQMKRSCSKGPLTQPQFFLP